MYTHFDNPLKRILKPPQFFQTTNEGRANCKFLLAGAKLNEHWAYNSGAPCVD